MSQAPAPAADAAPAAKKGPSKLIMGVAALALLGAGGGGAYWYTQKGQPVEAAEAAPPPAPKRGIVAFEPFTVNLADQGGRRFLRATVQLVVGSPELAKEMEESPVEVAQARAIILEKLTTQTADVLVTPEGKSELRKALTEQLAHDLHGIEVVDVLFSDFVVQF
jgi:flagellar protein FliL